MRKGINVGIALTAIIAFCVLALFCSITQADTQETHSVGYKAVCSQIATADHDPNAVERTWTYCQANYAGRMYVPTRETLRTTDQSRAAVHANLLQLIFTFNDASGTASVTIYGMRDPTGALSPLEPVSSWKIKAGTQSTGETVARYFADTAEKTSDVWQVKTIDGGGNNGLAKLELDTRGYCGFLVLFTVISASDNVSCYAAYY